MKPLFCLCLVCLMAFSLVGCQREDSKTEDVSSVVEVFLDDSELDEAFQFVKNIIILDPQDDGSLVMEIAHNTTVEEFFSAVNAKEGYELRVVNGEGIEMESSHTITSGDAFRVMDTYGVEPVVSLVFQTVDASEIENAYKNIK